MFLWYLSLSILRQIPCRLYILLSLGRITFSHPNNIIIRQFFRERLILLFFIIYSRCNKNKPPSKTTQINIQFYRYIVTIWTEFVHHFVTLVTYQNGRNWTLMMPLHSSVCLFVVKSSELGMFLIFEDMIYIFGDKR